jgi:predicted nucleic acid-binding protein
MIVIDASVWISFLVRQDVNSAVTRPWLTRILTEETAIAAPIILLSEVGGAISRRLGRADMGETAVNYLLSIPTLRLITMDRALGVRASQIAVNYQLRGADALYVAVAAKLAVPLVSWDREQLTRASDLIAAYSPYTNV